MARREDGFLLAPWALMLMVFATLLPSRGEAAKLRVRSCVDLDASLVWGAGGLTARVFVHDDLGVIAEKVPLVLRLLRADGSTLTPRMVEPCTGDRSVVKALHDGLLSGTTNENGQMCVRME